MRKAIPLGPEGFYLHFAQARRCCFSSCCPLRSQEHSWRRLGDYFDCLGAPLDPFGRSSWPSEASLGSLGTLPGRSRGASGALLGGFLALLGRTWGHQVAPDPSRDQFWKDFRTTWGSIWVNLATEFGEFGRRFGIRNYIHPDSSYN